MIFRDDGAWAAAMRHGRWQMGLLVLSFIVIGGLVAFDPEAVGARDGALTRELNRWSVTMLSLIALWALFLVALVVRHRGAIRTEPAASGAFATASVVLTVFPVAPGLLLWWLFGLPVSAVGLACLAMTWWFRAQGRRAVSA